MKTEKMPNCIKILYSFRRIISFTVQRLRFTVVVQIGRAKCVLGGGGKKGNTNFWGNCKPNFQTLYVATKIHADYIIYDFSNRDTLCTIVYKEINIWINIVVRYLGRFNKS